MNLQRSISNLQKKERRSELQNKILSNIKKRGKDIAFTHKWLQIIVAHIAFRRQKKEWQRRVDYAGYFLRVHWMVVRAKNVLYKKMLRQGPTTDERTRRYIKDSMISMSSMTDFTKYQASNLVCHFLQGIRARRELHRKMSNFHDQIQKIKQRFKEHF